MILTKSSWTCRTVVCITFLVVPCCMAFSYRPIDFNPRIETVVRNAVAERDKILQNCIDRTSDRLLLLWDGVARMLRTELGTTQVDILNNRALAQTREYTNDVWLIIDQTEKAIDVGFKNAERTIEQKLGNESPALNDVEDVFGAISSIVWRWQDEVGRLLYDSNEIGQKIVDGLAYVALDALQKSGRKGLEQSIVDRRNELLVLVNNVRDQIITTANTNNARIHELTKVILDAGSQSDC